MKKSFVLLAIAALILVAAPAFADTFTLANSNGGDGFVNVNGSGFDLFGSDNGFANGNNYATYTAVASGAETVSYNWSYQTFDCCGSFWDPAGYVVNGVYTQLSTDCQGTPGQCPGSGSITFNLNAGDTYGFYVYSIDSVAGRGELSVTTPEPGSMMLLGSGLFGIAGILRRRFSL